VGEVGKERGRGMERGERGRGRKKAKRQRQGEEGGRGEWGKGGRRRKRGRGEKEEKIVTKWGSKKKVFFCFFTMFSLWEWAVLRNGMSKKCFRALGTIPDKFRTNYEPKSPKNNIL
jgi:hypothetical protein